MSFKFFVIILSILFLPGVTYAEDYIVGTPVTGSKGVSETMQQIMGRDVALKVSGLRKPHHASRVKRDKTRRHKKQNPSSPHIASFPHDTPQKPLETETRAPQTIGLNFTAATLSDVGFFPPDSMGAIGPTQYILAINGLIRSFDKTTGLADGDIDVDPDVFFDSIRNDSSVSDPRIRYDRHSQRWFITAINVEDDNNRILIAVSDGTTITDNTIWRFFFINAGVDNFFDYPTLGIDNNALYIGGNTFSNADETGEIFVVRKSSILDDGSIIFTTFNNIINPDTRVGLYAPQGVDNFDDDGAIGYFVAVDNATFGTLILRRVINPGGTPLLGSNNIITVPATRFPITVRHLGNNNGTKGRLDGLDDRLIAAHIRDGKLWTVHNIGVNNNGVSASAASVTRNGCRWYQINVTPTTPTLIQSGTFFNSTSSNVTPALSYWMGSLMTSGQGHMALGSSVAGTNSFINASAAGRLSSDTLGTIQSPTNATASSTAYNPTNDPGDLDEGRRWGDYSYTSLDPCDDMTMWTAQEFCNATNSWGVRVTTLKAPPPATPTSVSPASVARGQASVNLTINGTRISGSGFFDPGEGFDCRLGVQIGGMVTVNSVTYVNPTKVIANISTIGAKRGSRNVKVINPDGQFRKGVDILRIT